MGKQSFKGFGDDKYKRFGDLKIVQSLMMKGEISEAEKILLSIKSKKGLDHIGFYLLANICRIKSKHLLALEFLQNSIKLNPLYADALSDIGAIYIEINNLNLAKKYLHKSLEINSDKLSSNINTGILYRKLGNIQLALKYFSKALEIDSNNSNLNFSIGQIYDGLGDFKQAIFYYRKSVSLDQKNGNAFLGLYTVYLRTCAWQSIANINSRLINFGTQFFEGGQPLALLFHDDDPYKQKMRAINHFNHHFKRRVVMPKFTKNKKIRLGYISNNFVIHPVSFLIEKVIELHNRSEFEIYAYSINPIEDEVTKKFYRLFDVFRNISKVNDDNAYKIIKEDNIDILIDLMGYTPGAGWA